MIKPNLKHVEFNKIINNANLFLSSNFYQPIIVQLEMDNWSMHCMVYLFLFVVLVLWMWCCWPSQKKQNYEYGIFRCLTVILPFLVLTKCNHLNVILLCLSGLHHWGVWHHLFGLYVKWNKKRNWSYFIIVHI